MKTFEEVRMRRTMVWAALAVSLTFLLLGASCATMTPEGSPDTGYRIEGFVGKSTTEPAVSEAVLLVDANGGKTIANAQTNFFGKYSFAGLAPGSYLVKAGKVTREVVIADRSVRLDIDLSAEGGVMDYSKTGKADAPSGAAGEEAAAEPGDHELATRMTGSYYGFSGSTETRLVLQADGTFRLNRESSYSNVEGSDIAWGSASQSGNAGKWSVKGSLQQGTITLVYSNGKKDVVQYRYDQSKGCYYFGGTLLCRE